MAVQTAIEETRKASEPAPPASAPTETASAPAAKDAVTTGPAGDFTPVPAQSDAARQQPPAPAGQRPRHVRKPLDKTHAIRGKGVSLRYSENWSVAPRRFANMDELIDVPPGHLHSKPLTSKIKITTEQRRSHEEALRRLEEVRTGLGAPASSYLTVGGWPAFQYRRVEERPSPGDKEELRRPQFKDDKMLRITTVVAAAELLVRLEAALPSDADPELIEETEAISRSLTFSSSADSRRTRDELARLRMAKPAQPAAAVASARPPAEPPAAEKNFTPVSGGASKTATLPLNEADLAPLRQEEYPEPGLTQRVITGRFGELEIAVSPNGRNIVIGQQSAFRSSNDGGQTFPFNGTIAFSGGDPSLAYGRSGNFYYAGIRGGCQAADAAGPAGYSCTGMARSTDNGQTFPIVANAVVCPNQTTPPATPLANACFPDQEHIAADRTNSAPGGDQVYSTWRNFDATDQDPGLVCSQDSGINWTAPITVGTGAFPRINVGQDGFVYVVYLDGGNYMLNKYSSCATGLAPQPGFPVVVTARSPVNCPFAGHDRCDQNPSSQTIAVDDTNPNHVYFSYSENTGNPNNENIMVRDSLDGGLTWPAARVAQVSSGVNGKRIMPWVCTTGGEAFVTWYDRRAATPCATPPCAANNDLTDYYAGRVRLDLGGNLVVGNEIKLTEVSDPWCASGWPCGTRGTNSSESCSVQPQLAGFCCTGLDANGNCVGSGNRCDFNPDTCTGGETCQNIGGGCPKYGDYNGNACAAGRLFAAWASATSPPSVTPASTSIDIFYTSKLVGDVPQIQVPGSVAFGDACVGATATQTL
ncbi:MAG TPA: hypothetical protein VD968_18120, partial [Pyrinomonadaceae bacterium]|nr:hypothetical protein [Pyrinomonadaceae bacterium]